MTVEKRIQPILDEIVDERNYQQARWGDAFDKKNTPNDWVAYIARYLGTAVLYPFDAKAFRTALLKVATLCVTAIEWCDRTKGKMAKRHYDPK